MRKRAFCWWPLILLSVGLLWVPGQALAQLPHLDPIPWYAPADSTSRLALVVDVDRFSDSKYKWTLNRVLLTIILPAGDDATFFVRMPHMTFDTDQVPVRSRWPWVIGEEAGSAWPGEERISSFGRIEVGVTGPMGLPLLGAVDYGLGLGLPTGSDRVYPYSSTSIPFRLELRKKYHLLEMARLGLIGGFLAHMGSGRGYLTDASFPSGWHFGANLDLLGGRGAKLSLTYDYHNRDSRRSQLAGIQWWLPWAADGALGFKAARELQGTLDRPADWYFTFSVRLDSPSHRLTAEPETP